MPGPGRVARRGHDDVVGDHRAAARERDDRPSAPAAAVRSRTTRARVNSIAPRAAARAARPATSLPGCSTPACAKRSAAGPSPASPETGGSRSRRPAASSSSRSNGSPSSPISAACRREPPPVTARAGPQQLPGHLEVAGDRFARAQRADVADRLERRAIQRRGLLAAEPRHQRGQALADAGSEHAGVASARAAAQALGFEQHDPGAGPRRRQVIRGGETGQPTADHGDVGGDGLARAEVARRDRADSLLPHR